MPRNHVFLFRIMMAIIFAFALIEQASLFAGLAAGTKILTPTGWMLIENLRVGEMIIGYDKDYNLSPVEIKEVVSYTDEVSYVIRINNDVLCATGDQLFLDVAHQEFRAVEQFDSDSLFLRKKGRTEHNYIRADYEIQRAYGKKLFYEIQLEKPHLFLASEALIVTHNFVAAAPALIPVMEAAIGFGTAIACVYLNKASQPLPNLELIKKQITQDAQDFYEKYYKNNKPIQVNQESYWHSVTYCSAPPTIAGILPRPDIYHDIKSYPWRYGPMYPLGKMTNTGDVACILLIMTFDQRNKNGTPSFIWQELGRSLFDRTDSFVKLFIEAEDKKALEEIRTFVKSWPKSVTDKLFKTKLSVVEEAKFLSEQGCFEKVMSARSFGMHALQRMMEKKISPWLVLHVLEHGAQQQGKNPALSLFFDIKKDIIVVLERKSGKIINVGHYKSDKNKIDDGEVTKTDLDQLNDNKQKHIKDPKHNWKKLVSSESWEEIKKIIKEIVETGIEGPYRADAQKKVKKIGGEIVEVTYKVVNGIHKIGSAWVK